MAVSAQTANDNVDWVTLLLKRSMDMKYIYDEDLEILGSANDEDLQILVDYLIADKDGSRRLTEELTSSPNYKSNVGYPSKYWQDIAAELQHFGGNTIANFFRNVFKNGGGVKYREILCDVCNKMKVNYNPKASVSMIEMNLLQKILVDSIEKMDDAEMKEFLESLDIKTTDFTKQAVVAALQGGILTGGFMSYQIALIVANTVATTILGRGLTFATNTALTRAMGAFAGPLGLILTTLWTLVDVAGPAYRVTIPAVIQVAYIRLKYKEVLLPPE